MKRHGIVILIAEQVKKLKLILFKYQEYSIPALGDRFSVIIETVHLPDAGDTHNVIRF